MGSHSKRVKHGTQEIVIRPQNGTSGPDPLGCITPAVIHAVRQHLIKQETAYQHTTAGDAVSSLWAHSVRVGRIAQRLARAEGCDEEPALLAGLLHDTGKFAHGVYHANDVPEERNAARYAEKILSGTVHEKWIPIVTGAILSTYLEGETTSAIGRVVFDADSLDKLGNMGVAQFFAKKALRRQFLDEAVLIRASIELTYAHHAPDTLKTATGRYLAVKRCTRTRRFYAELLEEWQELGLGAFNVLEEDIAGIVCLLVIPCVCSCGGRLKLTSDIRDSVKCRSVVVQYRCSRCGFENEFSFCLPSMENLPPR